MIITEPKEIEDFLNGKISTIDGIEMFHNEKILPTQHKARIEELQRITGKGGHD